ARTSSIAVSLTEKDVGRRQRERILSRRISFMRWLKKPKAMELLHMSQTKLQDRSKKVLAKLARKRGLAGWEQMSKDELLSALARRPRAAASSRRIKSASANRAKNSSKLKMNSSLCRIKRKSIRPQAQRRVAHKPTR